ncbi:MAG: amidohydrolase family protein [Pseudomonadota bacterium]|nr:amidohydrolase family protein [Pseudomonadota bacterium]
MPIIDSDAHVIESKRTWSYLAENEKHFAPLVLDVEDRGRGAETGVAEQYWFSGNFIQTKDNADTKSIDEESREMGSVRARLEHMDELNIDIQVLYPTIFLFPCARDAEQQAAQYRAYNRWLSDIWKLGGGRLRWAACVPTFSMHLVRDELIFAKENGACSVFIRPFECDRYVGDSYFTPLFKVAEELDLAITFHSANASYQNNIFHEGHNFGRFKLAMVAQFHWLLENELPKKHPNIRWAFIEAAASWIPYALQDVRSRLNRKGKRLAENPLNDNNIWVTVETSDDIPYVIECVGDENLLIGTDYGHTDTSAQIEALNLLKENEKIYPASVERILGANPINLYGF